MWRWATTLLFFEARAPEGDHAIRGHRRDVQATARGTRLGEGRAVQALQFTATTSPASDDLLCSSAADGYSFYAVRSSMRVTTASFSL